MIQTIIVKMVVGPCKFLSPFLFAHLWAIHSNMVKLNSRELLGEFSEASTYIKLNLLLEKSKNSQALRVRRQK